MMIFWMLAAGLCFVAASFVVLPLYLEARSGHRKTPSQLDLEGNREGMNVAIYRERLAEYEESFNMGEIDQAEFDLLKVELTKNLINETDEATPALGKGSWSFGKLPLITAVLIPLFALFAYSDKGLSWGAIDDFIVTEEMQNLDHNDKKATRESIDKLASVLEKQPDNHEGWYMLAHAYMNIGVYEKSVDAFGSLLKEFPEDPRLHSSFAEANYLADKQESTKRVVAAIDAALKLNPHDINMLEIKAIGLFQVGKLKQSLLVFRKALDLVSNPGMGDDTRRKSLNAAISKIEMLQIADRQSNKQVNSQANSQVNKQHEIPAQAPSAELENLRQIQILLEVDDSVEVKADTSVFVFARAANGPPMPLAVVKLKRSDLPKLILLDESMAMAQGMGLADFDKVQVLARISLSGIATPSPDDYQVMSDTIDISQANPVLKLVIKQQVKDF